MHMFHHLSFAVVDLARSAAFYDAVLSPLGYVRVWTHEPGAGYKEAAAGYGLPGAEDEFAIRLRPQGGLAPGDGFHVAFRARSREAWPLSIKRRWKRAGVIMEEWERIRNMVRIILPLSFSIPTDIVLKRFSIKRPNQSLRPAARWFRQASRKRSRHAL